MLLLAAASACLLWTQVHAEGASGGIKFTELPQAQREAFIKSYNAAPPASHLAGDHVFIGRLGSDPDHRAVIIVKGKCVVATDLLPPAQLDELIDGDPI